MSRAHSVSDKEKEKKVEEVRKNINNLIIDALTKTETYIASQAGRSSDDTPTAIAKKFFASLSEIVNDKKLDTDSQLEHFIAALTRAHKDLLVFKQRTHIHSNFLDTLNLIIGSMVKIKQLKNVFIVEVAGAVAGEINFYVNENNQIAISGLNSFYASSCFRIGTRLMDTVVSLARKTNRGLAVPAEENAQGFYNKYFKRFNTQFPEVPSRAHFVDFEIPLEVLIRQPQDFYSFSPLDTSEAMLPLNILRDGEIQRNEMAEKKAEWREQLEREKSMARYKKIEKEYEEKARIQREQHQQNFEILLKHPIVTENKLEVIIRRLSNFTITIISFEPYTTAFLKGIKDCKDNKIDIQSFIQFVDSIKAIEILTDKGIDDFIQSMKTAAGLRKNSIVSSPQVGSIDQESSQSSSSSLSRSSPSQTG